MSEFAVPSAPTPKPPPQGPALAYNKPDWSSAAKLKYSFEILKNGTVVQEFDGPAREFITVGRLPLCDLELEHPSISRYHAVIQFNDDGKAFLYDLGSGHGTRINKKPVDKHSYVPLAEGDQIKFGESTRLCIFHTEFTEEEEEPEETKKTSILIKRKQPMPVEEDEDQGVTWGLPEDAVDEDEEDVDENDPKAIEAAEKRLEEKAAAQKERMKRLFGDGDDSDEDSYYDRTGAVEKHKSRKTNKGKAQKVETYDSLIEKQKMTQKRIADIEDQLKSLQDEEEEEKRQIASKEAVEDDLDSYMEKIDTVKSQRASKTNLQKELQKLTKELPRLEKLVKLTKPTEY
ncbi:hypothetical protein K450DRAFT_260285 [Umbelopsis ramanniana AG]|uniref:FHA domain-containing protein n=1 Tax=Umbelopsis ramanniana AG TaxID=1314678 RepID=A0AAD5HB22_UMBRA|nr:uncharacterized protein K450DRAFT_260285 [Umbelopsis ramanniana AG]KAI8575748.1 hypothetical protein K450DRAFT_260285 [Umbelopsis ramanniana AG]